MSVKEIMMHLDFYIFILHQIFHLPWFHVRPIPALTNSRQQDRYVKSRADIMKGTKNNPYRQITVTREISPQDKTYIVCFI